MSIIDAGVIRAALSERSIVCLAAIEAGSTGDEVLVFLHGNAGRGQQEDAVRVLSRLDGVREVEVSTVSWTILVVHVKTGSA